MMQEMSREQAIKYFSDKKTAFQLAFGGGHGDSVMEFLGPFCHERRTCFHTDGAIRNLLEGRRQVLLRIREFLDLTPEQLVALYTTPAPKGAISNATRSSDDDNGNDDDHAPGDHYGYDHRETLA